MENATTDDIADLIAANTMAYSALVEVLNSRGLLNLSHLSSRLEEYEHEIMKGDRTGTGLIAIMGCRKAVECIDAATSEKRE